MAKKQKRLSAKEKAKRRDAQNARKLRNIESEARRQQWLAEREHLRILFRQFPTFRIAAPRKIPAILVLGDYMTRMLLGQPMGKLLEHYGYDPNDFIVK